MKLLLPLLLALGPVSFSFAQRNFDNVEIKINHVAGNVYMLEGSGGNIGVSVGEDGVLIVDTQFEPLGERILAALSELKEGAPKFVLNTHHHGDHVGGNPVFGKAGATIVAHKNVHARLATQEGLAVEAVPTILVTDSVSMDFNGEVIDMVYFGPAHTDGDCVIFFKASNVVHAGDQFFNGRFPYIDLGSGGSVDGYIANIEAILAKTNAETKFIPGHGSLATPADYLALHDMIVDTRSIIEIGIGAGKSLEDLQAAGLPEEYEKYNDWITTERWIETLYNDAGK